MYALNVVMSGMVNGLNFARRVNQNPLSKNQWTMIQPKVMQMKTGSKFCLDDMQGNCMREKVEGCEKCPMYRTYRECSQCGVDSTCAPIGDDNLCNACRVMNDV